VYTKNKKVALMLEHLKAQVNSLEFTSEVDPLMNLNWDEIRLEDEVISPLGTKIQLDFLETPISRLDHKQLPVSQRLRSLKLKSAKLSVLNHTSSLMNKIEANRTKTPDVSRGKNDSAINARPSHPERLQTPTGTALKYLLINSSASNY
jgi:hypothetical protein